MFHCTVLLRAQRRGQAAQIQADATGSAMIIEEL